MIYNVNYKREVVSCIFKLLTPTSKYSEVTATETLEYLK